MSCADILTAAARDVSVLLKGHMRGTISLKKYVNSEKWIKNVYRIYMYIFICIYKLLINLFEQIFPVLLETVPTRLRRGRDFYSL